MGDLAFPPFLMFQMVRNLVFMFKDLGDSHFIEFLEPLVHEVDESSILNNMYILVLALLCDILPW